MFYFEACFPIHMTSGHCGCSMKTTDETECDIQDKPFSSQNHLLSFFLARNHILCEMNGGQLNLYCVTNPLGHWENALLHRLCPRLQMNWITSYLEDGFLVEDIILPSVLMVLSTLDELLTLNCLFLGLFL